MTYVLFPDGSRVIPREPSGRRIPHSCWDMHSGKKVRISLLSVIFSVIFSVSPID